jgi:hypothetical protein
MGLGSGIRKKTYSGSRIPDLGPGVKKAPDPGWPDPGYRIPDPQHCEIDSSITHEIFMIVGAMACCLLKF